MISNLEILELKKFCVILESEFNVNIFLNIDDNELFIYNQSKTRTYKLIKKLTKDWILQKVELFNKSDYRNLKTLFESLNLKGLFYSTSYGIGYSCLFSNKEVFNTDINKLDKLLQELNIEYSKQFSDARYCLRFIISTNKTNLEKLKSYSRNSLHFWMK